MKGADCTNSCEKSVSSRNSTKVVPMHLAIEDRMHGRTETERREENCHGLCVALIVPSKRRRITYAWQLLKVKRSYFLVTQKLMKFDR